MSSADKTVFHFSYMRRLHTFFITTSAVKRYTSTGILPVKLNLVKLTRLPGSPLESANIPRNLLEFIPQGFLNHKQ